MKRGGAMTFTVVRGAGMLATGLAFAAPASAERLYTPWSLEPTTTTLPDKAVLGKPFLEQRLLPAKAASPVADVVLPGLPAIKAGTPLFLVYNAAGHVGYCPAKDFSGKNQLRSLFIPALDRRPCFVDRDRDGRFDATFAVFDKYGSAATPSGDLDSASALPAPIAYRRVDPHLFPTKIAMRFALDGSDKPEKTQVRVQFDKAGKNKWEQWDPSFPRTGSTVSALNTQVSVRRIVEREAVVELRVDPAIFLIGDSGGTFAAATLPAFIER